jgi:large subunit ribosomal protein L21
MYAIVNDRSRSLTLKQGEDLWVDLLPGAAEGSEHVFDEVQLLKQEDGKVLVGRPTIEGASVVAEVLGKVKDKKIHVLRFRRRKNSRTRTGHRQTYTHIRIKEIRS